MTKAVLAKYGAMAALVATLLLALFNARLGFGAQAVDCIDAYMSLVRYKTPETIARGQYVVFVAPDAMGDRFAGHLVIKKVGAVAGDHISIRHGSLYINDEFVGPLDIADKAAKMLHVGVMDFERDEVVPQGKLFVIGTKTRTYDSRYWGFLSAQNVIGSAYPLI